MMVSISGQRGVGKTLHLAERVYKRSKQGYFTITNFSHAFSNLDCSGLSPEEFLDVILNVIDFKDNGYEMFNIHPSFKHTGVYVAMDEATIYFSPEMQSKLSKSNPEKYTRLLNLLAQARKYDIEIDYVVQDPAKVGKDFRRYTEHYIRFRWILKLKRLAYVPHPRLPIYRREHRHLLDFVWQETHELDAENPKFNYSTITDENGIHKWAESSTLIERKIRTTGRYKRRYLRMYNSYQPVAVKQLDYNKEFSPLRSFRLIEQGFDKERFPTFKKWLGIKPKDASLPKKIGFPDLVIPPKDERNKIISEVQSQRHVVLTVEDLKRDIARAYAKGKDLKSKKPKNNIEPQPEVMTPQEPVIVPPVVHQAKDLTVKVKRKYTKKNSIKEPTPQPSNA